MPAPTPQQQRAIDAGGDVLVMAGAGAGKTSTLVARILHRVLDAPQRVALDRILVVTFNEAAAGELRHRLRLALEQRAAAAPEDEEVAGALALLETSNISTLHAFCLRLLREHFPEIGLDPQFAVQDEAQSAILRQQVLDGIFAAHYGGEGLASAAVRTFLGRHAPEGDDPVRALVTRVSDYARTLPDAAGWLAGLRRSAEQEEPVDWRSWIAPGLAEWARGWQTEAARIAAGDSTNGPATGCERVLASMAGRDGEAGAAGTLIAALQTLVDWGADAHYPRGTKGRWREPLEKLFSEAEEVQALLLPAKAGDRNPLTEDWNWARADLLTLLGLVDEFDRGLAQAKRTLGVVDFADLEQFALRLLWDAARNRPTPLAGSWRARLDLVLVDEYQDINGAQDRILACVSREGPAANRFLVGDIKQSIYRFRRADPRIFQRYAREWRGPAGGGSAVIPLSENFRSHEAILAFVNELFDGLMRESVGGVQYDAEARLQFGAPEARGPYRDRPEHRVALHLVVADGDAGNEADEDAAGGGDEADGGGTAGGEDLDLEEKQAAVAATRLAAMRAAGLEIWDPRAGAPRAATWSDMVVLHPAPRPVAERWARQFARAGIPLEAKRGGFFDAQEVSDLVHLARVLDNPLQDLPLLAVLRSPLVGMTADELAAIRVARRPAPYWEALEQFSAGAALPAEVEADPAWRAAGVSARAKAEWFLGRYREWRRMGREGSLAWCLETALAETSYEAWIRAGDRAEARLANVRRLLAMTRQFDQFQRHGLFRFLRFLQAQADAGQEAESASAPETNAVRLLSMHQSKGLEFPVVVVAGLGRNFNLRDLQAEWLLDEEFGICPPVLPPGRLRGYPSFARWRAGRRQRREAIGEQIRLLYVACTRAAERLLLVGSVRAKRLADWSVAAGPVGDRAVVQTGQALGWIGPRLGALTGDAAWADRDEGTGLLLDWCLHRAVSLPPAANETWSPDTEVDATSLRALGEQLNWNYPWNAATREAAKAAVTALRRSWAAADEEAAPADAERRVARSGGLAAKPGSDAIERGLAHHLFCELVRLEATATREGLAAEIGRLRDEGWLRDEQADALDLDGLAGFWTSELGARLRERGEAVQRELPFTLRLRPADAERLRHGGAGAGCAPDDFQVVQGVADLVVLLKDEIWLVDFKTDRVEGRDVDGRAAEYALQLRLYAEALTGIYRRPVTERWLYFIHPRRLVPVEPSADS